MKYMIQFQFIFVTLILIAHSQIEYKSCINGTRKIIFEDKTSEDYPCIYCPIGEYTIYKNDNISCLLCQKGSSNYGKNIILNSFSEKKLSRYNYNSFSECDNREKNKLCPIWKINPLSIRIDVQENEMNSKSVLSFNQYYMDDGELIIKYINYNGGINKYFNIFINNILMLKDDSEHSIIKTKKFNIKKGDNLIRLEYIINNDLPSRPLIYDDKSYLEILEIQMLNSETSSLECEKFDSLEQLKISIHNNCDYYVDKCSENDFCTFRFYSENKSEYCNIIGETKYISYFLINNAICKELINQINEEAQCDHCSYGQYLSIDEGNKKSLCKYCNGRNYSNNIVNDEEICNGICKDSMQLNKILYLTIFEDPSQVLIDEITVNNIGYVEVNYEKFYIKNNTNIFIEIEDFNNNNIKTIELINPDENNSSSNYYIFNIPIPMGNYSIKIKGKNLKLIKIKIKGTNKGGNYECISKLNTDEDINCEDENEYYSPIKEKCIKCPIGSNINEYKQCIFIEQFIDNKFFLDNNLLINEFLLTQNEITLSSEEYKYFLNLNPAFPLIYYKDNNKNSYIIGKELYKIRLVKGIYYRGIILSYISKDENYNFTTNIFIKCNTKLEKIELNKNITKNNINYYYFTIQSNNTCPYCLDSEITYIEKGKCLYNKQFVNIKINDTSLCVIKPYDNITNSKLVNESSLLLNYNSNEIEDKLLIEAYEINEKIPINYEKAEDEINTFFQKNISCEYKRKSISDMGEGVSILIVIASVFLVCLIGIIIWKAFTISKNKKKIPERNESLTELTQEYNSYSEN